MEKLNSLFPFFLYLLDSDFLNLKKSQFSKMDPPPTPREDSWFSLLENFFGLGYYFFF